MVFRLRPAGLKDIANIINWIPDAAAMQRWAGLYITYPTHPELLWKEIEAAPENAFAFLQDGIMAGFGQIFPLPDTASLHMARIIIAPPYRGQGLGRVLCEKLMKETPPAGSMPNYSLNVHPLNRVAINLYQSLGFKPAAEQPRYDVIRMIKENQL